MAGMQVDLRGLFSHCGSDYNALQRFLNDLVDEGEIDGFNAERIESLMMGLRSDIAGLLCIIHPDTGKCLFDEGVVLEKWSSDYE